MPGSATIGTSLVDDLLSVVDDLRTELPTDMGIRQWRVFVVRRTWSGDERGQGTYTESELELVPRPVVRFGGLSHKSNPEGRDEDGDVVLTEVSLTYTETELGGDGTFADNVELFYRLDDAMGQGTPSRIFVPRKPPFPDRERDIGWRIVLTRRQP